MASYRLLYAPTIMCGRVMQHVTCACHHIVCTCDARIRLYGVGCYPFVGAAGIRLPLTRTQLTSSRTRKSLCTTAVTAKWSVFCTAIYSTTRNSNEDITVTTRMLHYKSYVL